MTGQRGPWLLVDPGELRERGSVTLEPDESRHLVSALRCCPGDPVVLADGAGTLADGTVQQTRKGRVGVEIVALHRVARPSSAAVDLALAVLHGQAMDWALQKAVEVGVRSLTPVVAERSQLSAGRSLARCSHWRRIARQALKQCRRPWAMDVAEPVALTEFLRRSSARGGVVADQRGMPLAGLPESAGELLLVGPEGGFDSDEEQRLDRLGWPRLRLGAHTLRAGTAAVVGAAFLLMRAESR